MTGGAASIWMDGELLPWDMARVHVLTHSLHYGTGVYEGLRAYATPRGTAVFRHDDHLDRLFRSAAVYLMDVPYTRAELRAATHETIARNELPECYIRPLVYRGEGPMGLYPLDCPVNVAIAVWPWGAYDVVERDIARGEMYLADEVFFTGTAVELTPVREIDDRPVGSGEPGEVTRAVQRTFEDALHGRSERYAEWLDVVPSGAPAATT
jgi:branched-subunit amino acid aminotransferase/4-amino-4-deoxychorismate lyase